jgi:hypothetical protein
MGMALCRVDQFMTNEVCAGKFELAFPMLKKYALHLRALQFI